MANVTLSIDDKLLQRGRRYAEMRGTSLNAIIREKIADLTDESEGEIEAFMEALRSNTGNSGKQTWTREELYER